MLANMCVESHLRELLEHGFEVVVVKDATAGPRHPEWGEGEVQRYEHDRVVVVLFDEVGYKTLALDVVLERGLLEAV